MIRSADGYLVLSRRGRELRRAPGLMSVTAGGLVDCPADASSVDVIDEGLRETREEFGLALGVSRARTSVEGLFLSVEPGNVAPWLLLCSDSVLSFEELANRHCDVRLGPSTAWEVDGELLGLHTGDPALALRWLAMHSNDFCRAGAAAITVALWRTAQRDLGVRHAELVVRRQAYLAAASS
jgi:hypothetical protein